MATLAKRNVHDPEDLPESSAGKSNLANGYRSSRNQQSTKLSTYPARTEPTAKDILAVFPPVHVQPAVDELCRDLSGEPSKHHGREVRAKTSHGRVLKQQTVKPHSPVAARRRRADRTSSTTIRLKRVKNVERKANPKSQQDMQKEAVPEAGLDSFPSEEDISDLLIYRIKKDQQNKAIFERSLHARELEIDQLKRYQEDLQIKLTQSESDMAQRNGLLAQQKESIANKVGDLTKFVNGLANDHNKLRDDAKELKARRTAVRVEKEELATSIRSARAVAKECAQKLSEQTKVPIHNARLELDRLQGLLTLLEQRMEEKSQVLAVEQQRTARLEAQIACSANDHQQVKDLIERDHVAIVGKLDGLQTIFEKPNRDGDTSVMADLPAKMEQCLDLLNGMRDRDKALPEELNKICGPIKVLPERSVLLLSASNCTLTLPGYSIQSSKQRRIKLTGITPYLRSKLASKRTFLP